MDRNIKKHVRPKWVVLIFAIVFVVGVTGCNNAQSGEKGDYIIDKGDRSILVAFNIYKSDVGKLKEEGIDLAYYTVGDKNLLKDLQKGERVTVQAYQDETGHTMVMYSDPPEVTLGKIVRHSKNNEEWILKWDGEQAKYVRNSGANVTN